MQKYILLMRESSRSPNDFSRPVLKGISFGHKYVLFTEHFLVFVVEKNKKMFCKVLKR